ncbi:hypothetical protein [Rhizobium skierniewicense]|uniref:hypothetical protein n=1 Tax=Rhizobium skierniewicense TaxID=984260 RepID=UPI001574B201|nr:hypothetical protein [Rhizobium skierniewicense]NTF34268.1 hypothetical protein [Rhizobium skierniewicense]
MKYSTDPTEHRTLKTLLDFGVQWSLTRLFYQISHELKKDDEGREKRYESVNRDPRVKSNVYLKDDFRHLVECQDTGLRFTVYTYGFLQFIELSAIDGSWRFCFMAREKKIDEDFADDESCDENDGSIVVTDLLQIEGDRKEYSKYASALRKKLTPNAQHVGFKIISRDLEPA